MIALPTVPTPGRCRNGIHSASTTRLVATTTVPIGTPVRRAMPWCSTSHGSSPRFATNMSSMLTPNSTRPLVSCAYRRTPAICTTPSIYVTCQPTGRTPALLT